MKHTNKYLYGVDEVQSVPNEIVAVRLKLLMINLAIVNEAHYTVRDNERRDAILKAIRFWSDLAKHNEENK